MKTEFVRNDLWEEHKNDVAWFADGALNAAHNALDKHLSTLTQDKTALVHESEEGEVKTYSFLEVIRLSNKFANVLTEYGVMKGDRVFIFMPRIPELHISFLAALKTGAIAGTLFSAFQEEALKDRLENSGAKVVLTTKELAKRVDPIKSALPNLEHIVVVDDTQFAKLVEKASDTFAISHTTSEDYAFMLYTSGTTGKPKGVVHVHAGV